MDHTLRKPFVAGLFYPYDKEILRSQIAHFLSGVKLFDTKHYPKLIIVPHAGYDYSGHTAAWGYKQLDNICDYSRHFVVIGPSHQKIFDGVAGSSNNYWRTPLGEYSHHPPHALSDIHIDDDAHRKEHSIEVQIPFLQTIAPSGSMTCLVTGDNAHTKHIASALNEVYADSVYIISSDLSHYLHLDQAHAQDKKTIDAIMRFDKTYLVNTQNCACGVTGILIGLALARLNNWRPILLSYDTSASAYGDTTKVVGYASFGFYE